MGNAFNGCVKLKVRDDLFGDNLSTWLNNGKTCYLARTFYRTSYTGTEAGTHSDCFGGAGNNMNSLTNYDSIDSDWK